MMGKWYKITGISKEVFESWKDNLRDDVIAWTKGDEINLRIRLNWFEAFRMRMCMRKINLHNPIVLGLERVGEEEEA